METRGFSTVNGSVMFIGENLETVLMMAISGLRNKLYGECLAAGGSLEWTFKFDNTPGAKTDIRVSRQDADTVISIMRLADEQKVSEEADRGRGDDIAKHDTGGES